MTEENLLRVDLFTETYEALCKKIDFFVSKDISAIRLIEIKEIINEIKNFHKFLWKIMVDFSFDNAKTYKDCTDECIRTLSNIYLEADVYGLSDDLKIKIQQVLDKYLDTCFLDIDNTFIPFLNRTVFMKNLTLGIKLIDAQHKSLFVFIDKFIAKIIENATKNDILKVVRYLEKYTEKHFGDEENLMKESNYPEIEHHIKEHDNFKNTILQIKSQIGEENSALIEQILAGLNEWLIKHILESDKKFVSYYHGK